MSVDDCPTVEASSVFDMLGDGGEIAFIDVREAGQFGLAHPFHAVSVPYSRLELEIGRLAPRKSVRMVLTDQGFGVAERAFRRLTDMGYGDVRVLNGGVEAWSLAGYSLFKGVHVPSKAFGELIFEKNRTPMIAAEDVAAGMKPGGDMVLIDIRPFEEFNRQSIPGAINCPGVELVCRIRDLAPDSSTHVVVNCAGRTRGIIAAQSLIDAGLPNPLAALRDGTMGWALAGFPLESGKKNRFAERSPAAGAWATEAISKMVDKFNIPLIDGAMLSQWRVESDRRTLFVLDVRDVNEFNEGHLSDALSAPGGQLIQATDRWIGVLGARVVLVDDDGARATMTTHFLRQMGIDAYVFPGGIKDHKSVERTCSPSESVISQYFEMIDAGDLNKLLDLDRGIFVVDVGSSMAFRKSHIPGSVWASRIHLLDTLPGRPEHSHLVLTSEDGSLAQLAAQDVSEASAVKVSILIGGNEAWKNKGFSMESSEHVPPDADCIDYLFWAHDRHKGNRDSMNTYLNWEHSLPARVSESGESRFRITPVKS